MSGQSQKLLRAIVSRINKLPILSNASSAMEIASGKAQQTRLGDIPQIATEKYNTIVKRVNPATIIQDLNTAALQPSTPIPQSLINWWSWYQKLTGLEDVEHAQRHVVVVQDKLFECQEERRLLNNRAALLAEKLKEIYGELVQTKRDDPKYVQLTIIENKALQEQTRIISELTLLENSERDHFTRLATAIKEYHDKQSMNAQKYKYLSILASAILAIISLCGSMIYNDKRIKDMKNAILEAQKRNETTFSSYLDALENKLSADRFQLVSQVQDSRNAPIITNVENNAGGSSDEMPNFSEIFTLRNIWIGVIALIIWKAIH